MRRCAWLLAALVGACSGAHGGGPAWPKAHATDDDGGESLAPRASAQRIEPAAAPDEPAPAVVAAPAAPVAPGSAAIPAVPQTIVAPTEEINTEELNIEVDE